MRLDKFNNPIFNETDVFELLYQGNTSVLPKLSVDINQDLISLENTSGIQFIDTIQYDQSITVEEFDSSKQTEWLIPIQYKNFDIKEYCLQKCNSIEEKTRVNEELAEFERLGMIQLLIWCKYFVDVCTENDIMWGVGRGSSVSSYVLYLIGVHKINSIKYKLDWKEFLR